MSYKITDLRINEDIKNDYSGMNTEWLESLDQKHIMYDFFDSLKKQDVHKARNLIKRHQFLSDIDTRILNEDYPLKNYKFTKRKGKLIIYHQDGINDHLPNKETAYDYTNRMYGITEENKNGFNLDSTSQDSNNSYETESTLNDFPEIYNKNKTQRVMGKTFHKFKKQLILLNEHMEDIKDEMNLIKNENEKLKTFINETIIPVLNDFINYYK